MKKFTNLTKPGNEQSVKIGSSAPSDSANIALFSEDKVTSSNSLVVVDLSETIPENRILNFEESQIMFANELGVLEDINGNSNIPSSNISISDISLSGEYRSESIELNEVSPNDYMHSYYVSRHFTYALKGSSISGVEDIVSDSYQSNLNIKVVNEKGQDYIDQNTGRKKYKILLEPFATVENDFDPEIPHRIIVGFDSTPVNNLRLVYDKIESDAQGKGSKLHLSFSENINAVPYFEHIEEESLIMDSNNKKRNTYSIKKYNEKHADIFKKSISQNGYQAFVPKKALADNRVFEVFNWRLIAKANQSINLDLLGDSDIIEGSGNIKSRNINVCVLYNSKDTSENSVVNPYVFYNLENSPFNFSKFTFKNPLAQTSGKNTAAYWKVDIQSIKTLKDFDFVVFSPTKKLDQHSKNIISDYVDNCNGTIFVDGSKYPTNVEFYNSDIQVSTLQPAGANYFYNSSSPVLNENKNGGWNIEESIFEKDTYGIFGKKKTQYKFLKPASANTSILSIGTNQSTAKPIATIYQKNSSSDALVQSNIIFTTFDVLYYCNAIFNSAGDGSIISSNTGTVAQEIGSTQILSGIVEGPYKFLYNSISFALYCRIYSSRIKDFRSLTYNYVGDWNSSWTMFSDAILDEEKNQYFTNISSNVNEVKWGRDLIPGFTSLESYYRRVLTESLPDYQRTLVSRLDLSQVEYYIEITNPDVEISSAAEITAAVIDENIPSSYYLKKISDANLKPFAYTNKYSPKITVPGDFGPYVIKEVAGIKSSDTRQLINYIDPINQFKSYPFSLQTGYSYTTATDKPVLFNGSYKTNLELSYKGQVTEYRTEERYSKIVRQWQTKEPDTTGSKTVVVKEGYWAPGQNLENINCINFKSSVEKNLYASADSDRPYNNFVYTGDIDKGNSTNSWSTAYAGEVHQYVKFLQIAMRATGRYVGEPIDGKYGTKTATAIQNFQKTQQNLGNTVLYVDGIVDSETKALIHRRLITLSIDKPSDYATWRNVAQSYGVLDYWDASVDAGTIETLNQGKSCKKISFTGFEGPGTITDVIYFQIPDGAHTINKLKIDFGYWKNVTVTTYGWSNVDYSQSVGTSEERLKNYNQRTVNATPNSNGLVEIDLPNLLLGDCRHMYIRVRSSKKLNLLNAKFGPFAEGYAIETIKVDGKTSNSWVDPITRTDSYVIEGKTTNWTQTYEAVYGLDLPVDSSYSYLGDRQLRNFFSGQLYYENNKLKSYLDGHRVYVRGSSRNKGYYVWNASSSSWVEEIIPENATENIEIEDYIISETKDVYIKASATSSEFIKNLTPTEPHRSDYDLNTIWHKTLSINEIKYTYKNVEYTDPVNASLGTGSYQIQKNGITFDFSSPYAVQVKSGSAVQIDSLTSDPLNPQDTAKQISNPSSVVNIEYVESNTGNILKRTGVIFSTSATYYPGSEVAIINPSSIGNYVCVSIDGRDLGALSSVTINDGILLVAQKSGNRYIPTGIPDFDKIKQKFSSFPQNRQNEEIDIAFGYLTVYNQHKSENGFIYGFYDTAQKEFIGRTTSYADLLNRGINNIYIAVCAIDADGNTQNKVDYIGPKVSMTFKPVNIPLKKIYPIYSVKINSNSRIKVGNMSFDFDKTQAWPLPVSQGSFIKKIHIDSNIYTDWKSNYLNQELLCTYSTHNIPGVNYSKIFGKGYYDIVDENPSIISESLIKVRQAPFIVWPEPSSYSSSKVNLIRPQFEVYINSNTSAQNPSERVWQKVPFSKIKNYNALTGVIEFTERLVPLNEMDIKISYVAKNNDVQIYQVNGNEIPLNPLLNKDKMQTDKPLYIYIMPTKIEKRNNLLSEFVTYEEVTEYINANPVHFTYDKDLFNPASHKYDQLALLIGMVIYTKSNNNLNIYDTRLRGGGIRFKFNLKDVMKTNPNAISYWDMYPSEGLAYPKGGYIIIKLPNEVKNNFQTVQEIYDIVYRNMTAGVSFEIQDMDGNPYGVE